MWIFSPWCTDSRRFNNRLLVTVLSPCTISEILYTHMKQIIVDWRDMKIIIFDSETHEVRGKDGVEESVENSTGMS